MNLLKFTKGVVSVTILALVYINMQMQIVENAYRGKAKEKQIRGLIETNSILMTKIFALKSSNHLGERMLSENKQMEFLAPQSIVHVSVKNVRKTAPAKVHISSAPVKPKRSLISMLPLGAEAQAGVDR